VTPLESGLIITLFGVAFTAIIALLVRMNVKIDQQGRDIGVLQTQVSPLWARVQAQISSDLHHPRIRYAEMDGLLEKLEALTITQRERDRLKVLLNERATDMHEDITDDQRKKAKLMIDIMEFALNEAKETDEQSRTTRGI
jgi:hypothetical protein